MDLRQNTGVEGGETAIKLARRWGYDVKGVEQVGPELVPWVGEHITAPTVPMQIPSDVHFGSTAPMSPVPILDSHWLKVDPSPIISTAWSKNLAVV